MEVSSVACSSVSSSVASLVLVSVLVFVFEPELFRPFFADTTVKTNSIDKKKIGLMLKDDQALRAINMICFHFIHFDPYLYEMTGMLSCQHLIIGVISHVYSLIYILLDTYE